MTSTVKCASDLSEVRELLYQWLVRQVADESRKWLDLKVEQLTQVGSDRLLFSAFSMVPRYLGKSDIQLTASELQAANAACPGWRPVHWSLDQVGRSLLLLSLPAGDAEQYYNRVEKLFSAADVNEQISLYQSLPLLPHPEQFVMRAAEGLRTNIHAVFNAIALNNPFPADYFETLTWNQMVLKALFVESPIGEIHGFDRRLNPKLTQMLIDYAHERWAAGRTVHPELWRGVGAYATLSHQRDLERILSSGNLLEREAGALACSVAPSTELQQLLNLVPELQQRICSQQLSWDSLYQRLYPTRCLLIESIKAASSVSILNPS